MGREEGIWETESGPLGLAHQPDSFFFFNLFVCLGMFQYGKPFPSKLPEPHDNANHSSLWPGFLPG